MTIAVRDDAAVTKVFASTIEGYVARPSGTPKGALIVIHEIWGLVDQIKGVADRYAGEGYLVVAPDILSAAGVGPILGHDLHSQMTSPDKQVRLDVQPKLRDAFAGFRVPEYAAWALAALKSVVDWELEQPGVDGRVAVTGFCFGGTYSFLLVTDDPRVKGAIPFYGGAPDADTIASIGVPVLALYGEQDPNLMEGLPAAREAMEKHGVDFEAIVYPESGHAFFNETAPRAYNADNSADAWKRANAFLDRVFAGA